MWEHLIQFVTNGSYAGPARCKEPLAKFSADICKGPSAGQTGYHLVHMPVSLEQVLDMLCASQRGLELYLITQTPFFSREPP